MSERYGAPRKNPNTLWRVQRDANIANEALRRTLRYEEKHGKKQPNPLPDVPGELSVEGSTEWDLRVAPSAELVKAIKGHYHAHKAEYQDLATIQAYIEGVELQLEQPLVIGARKEKDPSE